MNNPNSMMAQNLAQQQHAQQAALNKNITSQFNPLQKNSSNKV